MTVLNQWGQIFFLNNGYKIKYSSTSSSHENSQFRLTWIKVGPTTWFTKLICFRNLVATWVSPYLGMNLDLNKWRKFLHTSYGSSYNLTNHMILYTFLVGLTIHIFLFTFLVHHHNRQLARHVIKWNVRRHWWNRPIYVWTMRATAFRKLILHLKKDKDLASHWMKLKLE